MSKYLVIVIVLLSLIIATSLDVEASQPTITQERVVDFNARPERQVREKRFLGNPFTKIVNLWNTFGQMYQLYVEQKVDTQNTLIQTHDIIADGFNDTYMATKRPTTTTTPIPDAPSTTSTEHYRISRKEFGYILGRNYRGLNKLLRIELNDAFNQSKYNIQEYKLQKAYALAPYTVKKFPPPKNTTKDAT